MKASVKPVAETDVAASQISKLRTGADWKAIARYLSGFLGLVIIVVIFQIASDGNLLQPRNMRLLVNQSFIIMCGAMGASFVLAQGNLDLSLGGVVGITSTLGVITAKAYGPVAALAVCLFIGLCVGLLIGSIHVFFKVPAIILTICMMFALRGITWILNNDGSIAMPAALSKLDTLNNKLIVVGVVFVIIFILFEYTKIGKYSTAIGANATAARQSGVPVSQMKILAYVLSGFFGGLCGFLSMIRAGSSSTNSGSMFEINVLTALVIGGMSLNGGSGAKMKAGLIGALMLAIIQNGLIIWGLNDKWQQAVQGVILIAAVAISYDRKNVVVID